MKQLLSDPRLFPCVILALYALSAGRWFIARNWGQGLYWVFAFGITFTVTFLMKAK